MKRINVAWMPKQVEFLENNYRKMSPKDMAEVLGFPKQKVVNKMSKSGFSSMLVIDREQTKIKVNTLLELGLAPNEIVDIVGTSLNIVDKVLRLRRYEAKLKEDRKDKPCVFIEAISSSSELKRLELNNFTPDHEEDERWKYSDLSDSEKLIYHFIKPDYLIDFKAHVQGFNQTNKIQFKVISEKEIESERINGYEYAI